MEETTFFGRTIPSEVKQLSGIITQLEQNQYRKAIQCVIEVFKSSQNSISDQQFLTLAKTAKCPQRAFAALYTAIYFILRFAIRNKVKIEDFEATLTLLELPPPFIADLKKAYQASRPTIESLAIERRARQPQLTQLKWRIDVIISTNLLNRAMKPLIMLQIYLDDGSIKTFEISIDKFHELRFNISRILRDLDDLEKLPILKIE
eukprot:TRINITY_DN104_c5_g1_i1.p1 TRINITY_DN104_c5_g1~~TRINITY_DN104_c5_g1_i1.p1  ORF type:complete len:205 (-),score=91.83 TRINITY_DN104_c5_g1_i1:94-708(-)